MRKERQERVTLCRLHRKVNNCWPEISAAVFPLRVTHESGRVTRLAHSPEKHPSPLPRNAANSILGIHTPSSSIFPSQRRALEKNDEMLGMDACSQTHIYTPNTEPEGTPSALHLPETTLQRMGDREGRKKRKGEGKVKQRDRDRETERETEKGRE